MLCPMPCGFRAFVGRCGFCWQGAVPKCAFDGCNPFPIPLPKGWGSGCRLSAGVCLEAVLILSNMSFIPVVLSAIPVIFAHLLRRIAGYAPLQTDKYASKIQLNTAVDKIKTASWLLLPFCFLPLCFLIGRAGGGIFQSGTLFDTAPLYVWRPLVVCLCFAFGVPIWLCLAKNH